MATPNKSDQLFGEIALKNRLLNRGQVDDCLKSLEKGQPAGAKTLAEVVEKKGLLSSRAIASITRAQNYREARLDSKLYGRIAVKNKFAKLDDVKHCLEAQKKAYLKGEPPPDFGELMRSRGHVTAEEDRAIRDAMRKLDKEQLIGRSKRAGAGADDDDDDMDEGGDVLGIAEPPEAPGRKKSPARRPSSRAKAAAAAAPAPAAAPAKGKPAGKSGKQKVPVPAPEPDEELDTELLDEEDDEKTSEAGAIGKDAGVGDPTEGGEREGITVEELLEEAAKVAGSDDSSSSVSSAPSSSSVSESASRRTTPHGEELEGEIKREVGAFPLPKYTKGEDTNDLMDVVIEAADLDPILPGEEKGEGGGGAAAAGATTEKADKIARMITPPGGVPRLEVPAAPGTRECPRCNVRVEAGMRDCLYCGYVFDQEGKGGSDSRRAAAAPPQAPATKSGRVPPPQPGSKSGRTAPAAEAAAGSDVSALAAEFDGLESLASCPRGELFRAKDKKRGGKACLVWKLPAGCKPDAAQIQAFKDDAAKAAGLKLKCVLDLERFGQTGGASFAVYADAPGTPAAARLKPGSTYDRMRSARTAGEVAAAIAETVKAGVFARELRPEAILLSDEGEAAPRIAAFGAARLCEPPAEGAPPADKDPFVPPERQKKSDRADVRTDLFGVGALLKLCLTGLAPTGGEPKDLPDVPGGLKIALAKTLEPATGKRFLDLGKLLEELEKAPGMKGVKIDPKR